MRSALFLLLVLFSFSASTQILQRTNLPPKTIAPAEMVIKENRPVADLGAISLCVDRPVLNTVLSPRDFSAVAPPPKINSDGSIRKIAYTRQPLAGETAKMWNPGETIKVYMNTVNGSERIFFLVKKCAGKWEEIANVKFDFSPTSKSDGQIKIKFASDKRYWSWIGRDVLGNPLQEYTMHFGFVNNNMSELEMERIILHEFGHALGFIHEHQSPAAGIPWDREKVYQYFAQEPNKWTRAEVDLNIFNRYSSTTTNYTSYDQWSIMHYEIPAALTLNGVGTPYNYTFSQQDRTYARLIYPFPVTASAATGTLRTGDDCDLVNFSVEYDVVASDKVEFVLELGRNQNNREITWWKQVGIPLTGNRESRLWVQNHSLIASENRKTISVQMPATELDANRGISFWKAKLLGVHTMLNYKWQVMPAIKGGCRVKLIWANDSCL